MTAYEMRISDWSSTCALPISGRGNVVGSATDNTSQLWGGVVLLGRAPITGCDAAGAVPGTNDCERDTEGASNALYGGEIEDDDSGRKIGRASCRERGCQ